MFSPNVSPVRLVRIHVELLQSKKVQGQMKSGSFRPIYIFTLLLTG